MFYVYIIRNINTRGLYYGYTNNIERRFEEHNKKGNLELIYFEAYKSEKDARDREIRLKQYAQALTALKSRIKDSLR